jgi:uncharacterized protein
MHNLFITLIIGIIGGVIVMRLKVPTGAMMGAMISVALFNILTDDASMPQNVRVLTQIAAGALVGTKIKYKDVQDLRYMIKPAILMIASMIILDLSMGYLMYRITGLDLITSLFACAPGGLVDTSLISSDLGADSSKVAILHLIRLSSVMILFPILMKFISERLDRNKNAENSKQINQVINTHSVMERTISTIKPEYSTKEKCANLTVTVIVAIAAGWIGYKLKIPAGTITFSMIAVGALNVFSNRGYIPVSMIRITQIFAGILIGETMTYGDVVTLKGIILPAFILLFGIIIINLMIGLLVSKSGSLELITSLLASAPGGLTDIALIAKDLGADVPKVAIFQLARHVSVIVIFPILIKLLTS